MCINVLPYTNVSGPRCQTWFPDRTQAGCANNEETNMEKVTHATRIGDIITKEARAHFLRYRQGNLFYGMWIDDSLFEFPVQADDLDGATVNGTEKAVTLMRYIRKAVNEGTFVKVAS